jgi:spore germination cell wall hydrolase CwlJ-like protein
MRLIPEDALAILTIWQESRGEDDAGKLAVAEVIWNRMRTRYSSDGTVAGTVLRPWQFSGMNTDDPNRVPSFKLDDENPIVKACSAAWTLARAGTSTTHGAVLYLNPKVVSKLPAWVAKSKKVATIGAHHFYVPLV